MRAVLIIISLLYITLLPSLGWSETVTINNLVQRGGLYYAKFTDVPFTGEVSGLENGKFLDGKKNGLWKSYWDNGQLRFLRSYKNGIDHGSFEDYWVNGQLTWKHFYKNGLSEGLSEHSSPEGELV